MTSRIFIPSDLPEAQTFIYISDYTELYDYDEANSTNSIVSIANIGNVTFSVSQPNVTVTLSNNRIWFNGYYTTGQSTNIKYFDPPFGNDITDQPSIAYSFNDVPPRKYIYQVNQPGPTSVVVTHTIPVNYNGGGNGVHTATRTVVNNIYAAYNFLRNYQYYTGEV